MDDNCFINRQKDLEKVNDIIIAKEQNENLVYLISAEKGVGKSAFSAQVLNQADDSILKIKVKSSVGESTPTSENAVFNTISKWIDTHALKYKLLTRQAFIRNEIRRTIQIKCVNRLVSYMCSFYGIIYDFITVLLGFKQYEHIDGTLEYNAKTYRYLEYVFSAHEVWLDIEDFHKIDMTSLSNLLELLKNTRGNTYLLEITTFSTQLNLFDKMNLFTEHNIKFELIELESLNLNEAVKVAQVISPEASPKSIEKHYPLCKGNLKDLRCHVTLTSKNKKYISGIKNALTSLSKDQMILLSFIANYGRSITLDELYSLVDKMNEKSILLSTKAGLQECIQAINGEIILFFENKYSISHNTISDDIFTLSEYTHYNLLVYRTLERQLVQSMDSENIELLLKLYARYDSQKLLSNITLISAHTKSCLYIDSSKYFLDTLLKEVTESDIKSDDLYKSIVDLYYSIGEFDAAIQLLDKLKTSSNDYFVLQRSLIYYRQGDYKSSEQILKEFLRDNTVETRTYNYVNAVLLINYLATDRYGDINTIFNNYLNGQHDSTNYELAFIYRLADESNIINSETLMTQSIDIFEQHDSFYEVARAKLAFANYLMLQGKLNVAEDLLVDAKRQMNNNRVELYNIMNSLSVLEMLNGKKDKRILIQLLDAEKLTKQLFDLILIRNNILAFGLITNDHDLTAKYAPLLQNNISCFDRKWVVCSVKYNLSIFYSQIHNEEKSAAALNYINSNIEEFNESRQEYWKYRMRLSDNKPQRYSKLIDFPCHLNISNFWWFSIYPYFE